ncbi:MAG: inositol monophosphatase [Candidatus Rokubacteria bacterium]|nr:inositol monophosphatase [Candidatus Rokubacteria bacterium]
MTASYLDVAVEAATRAGAFLLQHRGAARSVSTKSSSINLVTEIDRGAEALVVETIHRHFPDHSILAEEGGAVERSGTHRWVIDPLDGTTNFVHGLRLFAVSVALEIEGRTVVGGGATVNGVPLRVSATSSLADSLLATGFPYTVSVAPDNNLPEHAAFTRRSRILRQLGTAAITLASVAAGRLDGFWELVLGPWDVAAGGLLVEEAGGRISNLEGGPVDRAAPAVVASNGAIHDEMITTLKEVRAQ